ncbi:GFA family protein [Thalassotalea litorea]|uniref:GFA family protein n=1 Tax=Thalassotalea litorea TaxID=2020715 RepID=A0A5R9IQ18_9GAMM|nr:GFA family protein [Thalassotalea litorea]TLU65316.1 GFA family protein [Thalassotalea litorea]
MLLQGSCLCQAIVFQIRDVGDQIGHCHCSMCQKFHGAAFSTFVPVKLEHLTWLQGKELLSAYTADNGTVRQFCRQCGSSLTFQSATQGNEQSLEIALPALDLTNVATQHIPQPNAHVYTKSKVPWYRILDSLPQYTQGRDT